MLPADPLRRAAAMNRSDGDDPRDADSGTLARSNARLRAEIDRLREAQRFLEEQNRTLQAQASVDPLTGLANRRSFDRALVQQWRLAQRTGRPLSLLLMDVDYFKQLNDGLGHPAGDECLRRVTAAVREGVRRPGDVVARFGGEELAVLLPETGRDGALAVAESLRAAVSRLGLPHPTRGRVTVSVGVCSRSATFRGDEARFLALADAALYRAKAAGRDCVRAAPKSAARGDDAATGEAGAGADGSAN